MDIMFPDYNDTLLNIIGGIRKNYGYPFKFQTNLDIFNKKYNNIIIMILDGLGTNILKNNLDKNSFLRSIYYKSCHSIYPSTTTAATTSIKSGLTPIESGWTGWENYIEEIDKNVMLFSGRDYYTEEYTNVSGYSLMPFKMFYDDMDVLGYSIEPDFTKYDNKFEDLLSKSLGLLNKHNKQIQYIYYTEPDSIMHEFGSYSQEAKNICNHLDKLLKDYSNKLPNDTLLIISADHGHTNVEPIKLYEYKEIMDMLKRAPSNEGRCLTFKIKNGLNKEFEEAFNSSFGNIYKLYKTEDAIELGFFGTKNDIRHPRIKDFLADYIAVAIDKYYFEYKQGDGFIFKSHHAGITKDEIEIPLLIVRR